jgi:hypothetical protein
MTLPGIDVSELTCSDGTTKEKIMQPSDTSYNDVKFSYYASPHSQLFIGFMVELLEVLP